jgi:2'-5' RNA ligase
VEIERLRPVAAGIAWVAADNLHVTLKFLGEVEDGRVDPVLEALRAAVAASEPFDLDVRGLGAFPSPGRPRVLWAGIDRGAQALAAVAGRVEAALTRLGFAPEGRPFAAHVTLGRVREPRRDPALAAALVAGARRDFGTVRADCITLVRSQLSPRGARHTVVQACAFGGG